MTVEIPSTADILIDALADGRTDVIVSNVPGDTQAGTALITKLKANRVVNPSWRFYTRTIGSNTKVIVMSPRCSDPAPPKAWNFRPKPAQDKKKLEKTDHLQAWVLENLLSSRMLHISVVPAEDIKRLKSVANYEQYMTQKAQQELHREDVRVVVRDLGRLQYNASLIFLEE